MSIVNAEHEPKAINESLRDLRELAKHPGWTDHILPMLRKLESEHTEAAITPGVHHSMRDEHIQAIHAIRKIIAYPETETKNIESAWRLQQKKPTSA